MTAWPQYGRGKRQKAGANRAESSGVKKIEICVSAPTAAWHGMAWHGMVWHSSPAAGHPGILAAWRLAAFQSLAAPAGVGLVVGMSGRRLHFNANVGLAATSVVDIFHAEGDGEVLEMVGRWYGTGWVGMGGGQARARTRVACSFWAFFWDWQLQWRKWNFQV